MPNPDVRYPTLKRPSAFICVQHRCSLPLFSVSEIQQALEKILSVS